MRFPPILPEAVRLYIYAAAFLSWAVVQGALAYYGALELAPPDLVTGAAGVVEWLVGAGLLTAATHTGEAIAVPVGRHTDLDGDGRAG